MKTVVALAAVLLCCACQSKVPLVEEATLPVDPAVIGVWEEARDGKESPERMLILPFSPTEYLVHYPTSEAKSYYSRAWPIEVGGVACFQVEMLGNRRGPADKKKNPVYLVMQGAMQGDELELKLLNTDLVKGDTTVELREAFLEHRENRQLFRDPARFRRVKPAAKPAANKVP